MDWTILLTVLSIVVAIIIGIWQIRLAQKQIKQSGTDKKSKSSKPAWQKRKTTEDNVVLPNREIATHQPNTSLNVKSSLSRNDWFIKYPSPRAITLEEIVLDDAILKYIKDYLIPSIANPNAFRQKIVKITKRGIDNTTLSLNRLLLIGPPGSGKTMLVEVIAYETGLPLYRFRWPDLLNGFHPLVTMSAIFSELRKLKPCIFFIDEVEQIAAYDSNQPNSIATDLILQLDEELDEEIVFICATNRPEQIEPALVARLHSITIGLPDQKNRERLINIYLNVATLEDGLTTKEIASMMKNWTPKEIKQFSVDLMIQMNVDPSSKISREFLVESIKHSSFPK